MKRFTHDHLHAYGVRDEVTFQTQRAKGYFPAAEPLSERTFDRFRRLPDSPHAHGCAIRDEQQFVLRPALSVAGQVTLETRLHQSCLSGDVVGHVLRKPSSFGRSPELSSMRSIGSS